MVEVLLIFRFGPEFDEARIRQVAEAAQGEANGTPGLRSKVLMIDAANRGAVHVYAWDSEGAARAFLTPDRVELITALYGVRPSVQFVHEIRTVALVTPARDRATVTARSGRTTSKALHTPSAARPSPDLELG